MYKIGSILLLLSPEIGHLYLQEETLQVRSESKYHQLEREVPVQRPLRHQKRSLPATGFRAEKFKRLRKPLKSTQDYQSRKRKQIMTRKKLQVVWPKDGHKGSDSRGFFGGLRDIFGGTGPDMFLQKAGRKEAIRPGEWGNWDSYHDHTIHNLNTASGKNRGNQRYDPYSRKYTEWAQNDDHFNQGVNGWQDRNPYPRFTMEEMGIMHSRILKGKDPKPSQMGSDWTHLGPKRFRPEHDYFWQHAHRIGENVRHGLNPQHAARNPWLNMGQLRRSELSDWADMHWP